MVNAISKTCKHCGVEKPRTAFRPIPGHKIAVRQNCFPCENIVARKYNAANPEALAIRNRKSKLKRAFGISLEDFDNMLAQQNGVCAICGTATPGGKGNFVVDHCHKTGAIRGLLCNACNVGIGALRDDPALLEKAITYLKKGIL